MGEEFSSRPFKEKEVDRTVQWTTLIVHNPYLSKRAVGVHNKLSRFYMIDSCSSDVLPTISMVS